MVASGRGRVVEIVTARSYQSRGQVATCWPGEPRPSATAGLGESLLLARRLCEAGRGFVTMHNGNSSQAWDMHDWMRPQLEQACPPPDRAVGVFLDDLKDRGLSGRALLVLTGESAARRASTAMPAATAGARCARWRWPAAAGCGSTSSRCRPTPGRVLPRACRLSDPEARGLAPRAELGTPYSSAVRFW
jgi:hypothetical protein